MITSNRNNNLSFNGFIYSKLKYQSGNNILHRIYGPVHVCQYGDNALVRKVNETSKKNHSIFKVRAANYTDTQEPVLEFTISKDDYKKHLTLEDMLTKFLCIDEHQEKVLSHKNAESIHFILPQNDYRFLKYDNDRYFINPFMNFRIKKFEQNIRSYFHSESQQKWLDKFFGNK